MTQKYVGQLKISMIATYMGFDRSLDTTIQDVNLLASVSMKTIDTEKPQLTTVHTFFNKEGFKLMLR